MSSNKAYEKKEFLISMRKKTGPGLTNAPVWILQKAGKRIWNPKRKRHWKEADFGKLYEKLKKREKNAKQRGRGKVKRKVMLHKKSKKGKHTGRRVLKTRKQRKIRIKDGY